jgi:hypothetical protein
VDRSGDHHRVIVVGERNSGTNYVDQLIAANLDVTMVAGVIPERYALAAQRLPWGARERAIDAWFAATRTVWKHGLLDERAAFRLAGRGHHIVAVVKHPLAWAVSMHRRPYHRVEEYDDPVEFASTPWLTIGRERMGRRTMANCFELWATKQDAYLSLADRGQIELWRYEDVLEDERLHLELLADRVGVEVAADGAGVPDGTKFDDDRDQAEIREYYARERWREAVAEPTRRLAADVCGDVARRLRYEL